MLICYYYYYYFCTLQAYKHLSQVYSSIFRAFQKMYKFPLKFFTSHYISTFKPFALLHILPCLPPTKSSMFFRPQAYIIALGARYMYVRSYLSSSAILWPHTHRYTLLLIWTIRFKYLKKAGCTCVVLDKKPASEM